MGLIFVSVYMGIYYIYIWPLLEKTYIPTYVSSEDSDQPAHSRSLIRIFTKRIFDRQECEGFLGFFHAGNEDSDQTARMRRLI